MELVIRTMGARQLASKFSHLGRATVRARPALQLVADIMMEKIGRNFESQGRRGGGSWRQLTEEWLTRKLHEGKDPRIGFYNYPLFDAFTVRGAPHQILEVTNSSIDLTTDLPYAEVQERERPFLRFTVADRAEMRTVLRDYIMEAFRA